MNEMIIFYEAKDFNGTHLTLYAIKGDKENVYLCITPEGKWFAFDRKMCKEFYDAFIRAGLYLGITIEEIEEIAEIEAENETILFH